MFKPNKFIVAGHVELFEQFAFKDSIAYRLRKTVPGPEIMAAFNSDSQKIYHDIEAAKTAIMSFEEMNNVKVAWPIFEMNGSKIVYVHFQGNIFTPEWLEESNPEPGETCSIL